MNHAHGNGRRLRLLMTLASGLLLAMTGLALAHSLSISKGKRTATAFVARQAAATPGATSSEVGACSKKSTHKVNCGYTIRGTRATGAPFSCFATAVVVLRGRHAAKRPSKRTTVRKSGERCSEGQPPAPPSTPPTTPPTTPPPATTQPFFSGAFTQSCSPELVPPCQQVKVNGRFDEVSRGRQVRELKVVLLAQGGSTRKITFTTCPTQLPDENGTTTTTSTDDTFSCIRSSSKPPNTVESSDPIEFSFRVSPDATTGMELDIYGKVDGVFQGPIRSTL